MYVADTSNNRVRKVTVSTGIITTIAGTGTSSYSGDGGQATTATLKGPKGVALDASGIMIFIMGLLHLNFPSVKVTFISRIPRIIASAR